jgi:hypothetical protein
MMHRSVQEMRADEYGVEELVTVLKPAPRELYSKSDVYVPSPVARILRPHQREGVQFIYECVMGLKDYKGRGVILADGTCLNFVVHIAVHCNFHLSNLFTCFIM